MHVAAFAGLGGHHVRAQTRSGRDRRSANDRINNRRVAIGGSVKPLAHAGLRLGASLAALCLSAGVCAAPRVEIIKTDLEALIRAATTSPVQFAVNVPHSVSAAK